jgi:hypothetical protein
MFLDFMPLHFAAQFLFLFLHAAQIRHVIVRQLLLFSFRLSSGY